MGRLLRPVLILGTALVLAAALTLLATTLGGTGQTGRDSGRVDPVATAVDDRSVAAALGAATSAASPGAGDLTDRVAALQARLQTVPRDHRSWSTLALAYIEQARITADPTYYPRAEQALARAARIAPDDSVLLTAHAALAAARHDFTAALRAADRAIVVNPYSAAAQAVRSDALTELGRYDAARRSAERADNLDPGPATFARLSYAAELRGDLVEATRLMRLSQRAAGTSASSYAFASFHLGELARAAGDLRQAAHHYANALDADPTHLLALAGRARLAVARGELGAAVRDYTTVVRRLPLPEYVVELGELYDATGRPELAAQQYSVARASARLAKANGVQVDLETALFEADHGSSAAALAAARAEWAARQSIHTADALGWALHSAGRDRAALHYVRLATRLGTQDARLLFHRGAVEAALGLPTARAHLRQALRLDAGVSPWREQAARALLASGGAA